MMRWPALLVALALGACMPAAEVPPSEAAAPAAAAPAAPGSARSARVAAYFAQVQRSLLARGMLRTDPGPEIPLDADAVVRTFLDVALFSEYRERGGRILAMATAARLQKWAQPVSIQVIAGPSVPPEQAQRDRAEVAAFAARLARVSGHPIRTVASGGNFTVLILTEDERLAIGPTLQRLMPGLSPATQRAIVDMPVSTYCLVAAHGATDASPYQQAVAVIRAELPQLLRFSCFHEELTQGLGLPNDDPRARPSIFNDDEEFAYLTRLDELLLRILYDPRLRPGMTAAEAEPIVRRIVEERLGGTT